jgi:hypothetical protein
MLQMSQILRPWDRLQSFWASRLLLTFFLFLSSSSTLEGDTVPCSTRPWNHDTAFSCVHIYIYSVYIYNYLSIYLYMYILHHISSLSYINIS